jgi:hypothetical protein
MTRIHTALALAALTLTAAVAARADDAPVVHKQTTQDRQVQQIVIRHGGEKGEATALDAASIPGDHLRIDDLATLAAGDSRTYTTEGGKEVTVAAKGNDRYTLGIGDHSIEIGAEPEAVPADGAHHVIVRKEVTADGKQTEERQVIVGAPGESMPADPVIAGNGGADTVVIEIVGQKDGKEDRRLVVLRTLEKKDTH